MFGIAGCAIAPAEPAPIADIEQAETLWRRAALRNYRFVSSFGCFCDPAYQAAMVVEVRNGLVTRVASESTGQAVPLDYRQPIDSIFRFIRDEAVRRPEHLRVTYDPTLGYPITVLWGTIANDAGGSIEIRDVRRLP